MIAGELQVVMSANLARLADDMNKTKSMVGGAMQKVESSVASAKSALGSLGVGIGFAAIAAGVKGIVDAAASLDDMAEKTGASVEQLSKLSQVASIGGHSLETAETAMIRLSKALHGGDEEAKGAGKALAALGLEADALRGKDTAESLRIVAVELNKYQDGAGKTALALDLLGKSGAQALPFLKDLATEQGIATRVTTEQAAAAEELQKNLRRLTNDMAAAKQALVLGVVPAMSDWVAANREALRIGGSVTEMLRLFVFNLEAMTTEKPGQQIRRLTGELEALNKAAEGPFWKRSGFEQMDIWSGRAEDMKKQLEFLKFLQRQEAAALGGKDTPGEMQRFGLSGAKLPLNYAGGAGGKAGAEAEGPFRQMMADLQKKLLLDKESTEVDQLIVALTNMKADAYAKLTIAHLVELEAAAHEVDLKKQGIAADKAFVDGLEAQKAARKEVNEALAAEGAIRDAGVRSIEKTIDQLQFETKLLGMSADERNRAIAARELEVAGIGKLDSAYEGLLIRLTQAKVGHDTFREALEAQKQVYDEMGEFAKEAAANIQRTLSDNLFDVMQGKFDFTADRFKAMLDRMVADALAKNLASAIFGDMDKTGQIGGWVGKAMESLGFGNRAPVSDAVLSTAKGVEETAAATAFAAEVTTSGAMFSAEVTAAGVAFVPEVTAAGLAFSAEVAAAGASFAAMVAAGGAGGGAGGAVGGIVDALLGDLGGFASGGSFRVGGHGGTDSQLVAFRASPNERVTVETPGQQTNSSGRPIIINNHFPLNTRLETINQAAARTGQAVQRALARNT